MLLHDRPLSEVEFIAFDLKTTGLFPVVDRIVEFGAVRFTLDGRELGTWEQLVDAPYVAEFSLVLECKVLHIFDLGLHTQFVGEILDVKADEEVLDGTGMPDILKVLPIIFSPGNREYYGVGASLGHAFAVGKEI